MNYQFMWPKSMGKILGKYQENQEKYLESKKKNWVNGTITLCRQKVRGKY